MKKDYSATPVIVLVSIYLALPIAVTFVYSLFQEWMEVLPKGLTFRYYAMVFSQEGFGGALLRSVVISIAPVLICAVIILLAMYVVVVYLPKMDAVMQVLCTIPYAIQGVILAVSVLTLYSGAPKPFSNRVFMLVATYCVFILPYMYRGIKNSFNAINVKQLMDAAQVLGAKKLYAFAAVIVPNTISGITVSALLSMALLFGDFVIVNIIGGSYYSTAQMHLYRTMNKSGQLASAMVIIMFAITFILSMSVFLYGNRKDAKELEEQ